MRLPEKVTYTLPSCDASAMKIAAKLLSGSLDGQTLLETEQLNVELSMVCDISPYLVAIIFTTTFYRETGYHTLPIPPADKPPKGT